MRRHVLPLLLAIGLLGAPALAQPARTVEVALSEWAISLPAELPAGRTTFVVTNAGEREHNLAFEREGTGKAQRFAQRIPPGQSVTMTIDLAPGTYRVDCPIFGHAAFGMDRVLTVRP